MHKQNKDPDRILRLFLFTTFARSFQRQSPEGFLSKICSDKFREIHKKAPAMAVFLNKVAGQVCNIIEKGGHLRCLPVILTSTFKKVFHHKACPVIKIYSLRLYVSLKYKKKKRYSKKFRKIHREGTCLLAKIFNFTVKATPLQILSCKYSELFLILLCLWVISFLNNVIL